MEQPPPLPNFPPPLPPAGFGSYSTPPNKRGILAWWAAIPTGIFFLSLAFFYWPHVKSLGIPIEEAAGRVVGAMLGGIFIALLIAWIVHRASSGMQLASSLVYSAILMLVILSQVAAGFGFTAGPKIVAAVAQNVEQKENTAVAAMHSFGSMDKDLAILDKPGVIEDRLAQLPDLVSTNQMALDTGDNAEFEIGKQLDLAGASPTNRAKYVKQFHDHANWNVSRKAFVNNARLFGDMRAFYTLLKDQRGHWEFNSAQMRFDFADPATLRQFNEIQSDIQMVVSEQKVLGRVISNNAPGRN